MKIERKTYPTLDIVGDGALSTDGVGEGRLIPVLIIDAVDNMEVIDLMSAHKEIEGDIIVGWSKPLPIFSTNTMYIDITFLKPVQLKFAIAFNLKKHFSLIDGIVQTNAFYLQVGKYGDSVMKGIKESILLEVPDKGFEQIWSGMIPGIVKDKYKAAGRSKKVVKEMADEHIRTMRDFWKIRRTNNYKK